MYFIYFFAPSWRWEERISFGAEAGKNKIILFGDIEWKRRVTCAVLIKSDVALRTVFIKL